MGLFQQAPKQLCILRLSAVGDVCNTLAVVQHIQQYWQNTQITWIIGKTEAQLFKEINNIEFIVYDKKAGWKGILQLWRQLKDRQFDALLNMQTALRASILSIGIRAKYKIGFGKQRSREGQWFFVNRRVQDPQTMHVLDGLMAFADYLGVPHLPATESLPWQLPISSADQQIATQFIQPHRKNILISPCSSKKEKDWLIERYAEIANIANQRNANVIFCGSPSPYEQEIIRKIIQLCDFVPTNAAGKTNLTQLAALIARVDLVISPDSAPAHLASMQKIPVIGLYAYHNPLRTGPYNHLENVVSVYAENLQKEQGKPASDLPWVTKLKGKNLMADITVDMVVKQLDKFIHRH